MPPISILLTTLHPALQGSKQPQKHVAQVLRGIPWLWSCKKIPELLHSMKLQPPWKFQLPQHGPEAEHKATVPWETPRMQCKASTSWEVPIAPLLQEAPQSRPSCSHPCHPESQGPWHLSWPSPSFWSCYWWDVAVLALWSRCWPCMAIFSRSHNNGHSTWRTVHAIWKKAQAGRRPGMASSYLA